MSGQALPSEPRDDQKDLEYEGRVEHVSTSSDEKLPHGAVQHDDAAVQDWTPEEERKIVSVDSILSISPC